MNRTVLFLAAGLLTGLTSASAAEPNPLSGFHWTNDDPACAPFDTEPPTCPTPNPRGLVPTVPLEWGDAARSVVWQGRLHCASGAMPDVVRTGSQAVADVQGTEGQSPVGAMNQIAEEMGLSPEARDTEMIDRWVVQCPGEAERVWFASIYRCGDPCLPEGFRLAPRAALDPLVAAGRAGDVAAARQALKGWEGFELPVRLLLDTAVAVGASETVIEAFGLLNKLEVATVSDAGMAAQAFSFTGEKARGRQMLQVVAEGAGAEDSTRRELFCVLAKVADNAGVKRDATRYRKEACGRDVGCCPAE